MAKYTPDARLLIAECFQNGLSYAQARSLVLQRFGVDMPEGTYNFQRSYLKHRTPQEMADRRVAPIGDVIRARRRAR